MVYQLGNEVIKEAPLYAATQVEKRTIGNSIQYAFKNLAANLFTIKGILTVVGIVAILAILIVLLVTIKSRRNRRRSKYIFKSNRRNHSHRNYRYNDGPRMRKRRRR